jgi:hypothetical protein
LSDQERLYVIKTHDHPFKKYHSGEKVLQVVRNPGASYWSYFKYLREIDKISLTMEDLIQGKVGFGSWKIYHDKYIMFEKILGKNYFRFLFEEFKEKELNVIRSLESFLDRPLLTEEITPFDYYRKKRPELARKGAAFGWEENYTREQLELLWDLHNNTMEYYGYPEPNFDLAKN